jgi:hypothetical protein
VGCRKEEKKKKTKKGERRQRSEERGLTKKRSFQPPVFGFMPQGFNKQTKSEEKKKKKRQKTHRGTSHLFRHLTKVPFWGQH